MPTPNETKEAIALINANRDGYVRGASQYDLRGNSMATYRASAVAEFPYTHGEVGTTPNDTHPQPRERDAFERCERWGVVRRADNGCFLEHKSEGEALRAIPHEFSANWRVVHLVELQPNEVIVANDDGIVEKIAKAIGAIYQQQGLSPIQFARAALDAMSKDNGDSSNGN